jgi:WD40 repeat protein
VSTIGEAAVAIDAEHPWPGLMPFTEEAQAWFHGRDQEAQELLRLIRRETLTVLFGQSGLGKSSLLNAGLFPRLRTEDYLPVYIRLDVSEAAPPFVGQVLEAIAAACRAHGIDGPSAPEGIGLWEYLHRRDADFWSTRNRLLTPVLVFDQFEEIFTLGRHGETLEARCREFVEELADVVEQRVPARVARAIESGAPTQENFDYARRGCKVVFSFREDYLPDFEGLRESIRPIMQNRMRLTRMSGTSALEAIRQPGSHLVPEEVAAQIVRFVAAPRAGRQRDELERLEVEPALLSVVCRELNNQRLRAGRAEITADLLQGGAQQRIIQDFYESSLEDVDERVRWFVEDQLLTDAGYRDSAALEDALRVPGVTREAVDRLIARRLLRVEERSGVLRLELTHDVLTQVAHQSRELRKAREAERRKQEEELARRRRVRRLGLAGGFAMALTVGVAVVFAVLLNRANHERTQLIATQSSVLLARANSAFEQNVPAEPYAMLAEAIRIKPDNRAAVARAVAAMAQRSHARLLGEWETDSEPALAAGSDGKFLLDGQQGVHRLDPGTPPKLAKLTVRSAPGSHEDFGLLEPEWQDKPLASPLTLRDTLTRAQGFDRASGRLFVKSKSGMLHLFDPVSLAPAFGSGPRPLSGDRWAASADAHWAAVQEGSGTLRVLDVASGTTTRIPLRPDHQLAGITSAGTAVLLTPAGASIHALDAKGQRAKPVLLSLPGSADRIAHFSRDGEWLVAAAGAEVAAVHVASAQKRFTLLHPARVTTLEVDGSSGRMAIGGLDKTARVYSLANGQPAGPPLRHHGAVLAVRFNAEPNVLLTGSADGTARVWDAVRGEMLFEPMMHHAPVLDVAAVGNKVLARIAGRQLALWQRPPARPAGAAPLAHVVALSQDGSRLARAESGGMLRIYVFDRRAGQTMPVWERADIAREFSALEFSMDGARLAGVHRDGGVTLFDSASGRVLGSARMHPGNQHLGLAKFSPDGRRLVTVGADATLRIWDGLTAAPGPFAMTQSQAPGTLAFSPDGSALLVGTGGNVEWWDLSRHEVRHKLQPPVQLGVAGEEVRWVGWTQGAAPRMLVLSSARLLVYPLATSNGRLGPGGPPSQVPLHQVRPWTAAASPDGHRVAIGSLDGSARIYDLTRSTFIGEPLRHDDAIVGLQFSRDGTRLLTWSRDRSVRVWDVSTGAAVSDPAWFDEEPRLALFDSSGADVLVATPASTRRIRVGSAPEGEVPPWLPSLVEAAGSSALDMNGAAVRMPRGMMLQALQRAWTDASKPQQDAAGRDDAWSKWGVERFGELGLGIGGKERK